MIRTKGEAGTGDVSEAVRHLREIDREITDRTKDFMARQVKAGKPFFAYVPYTMTHMPVLASKEFDGKSGNGAYADVLMQIDTYVGELLDTIDQLKAAENTICIFTSDNGPEMLPEHHGWSGPWSGSYSTFTAAGSSANTAFMLWMPPRSPCSGYPAADCGYGGAAEPGRKANAIIKSITGCNSGEGRGKSGEGE